MYIINLNSVSSYLVYVSISLDLETGFLLSFVLPLRYLHFSGLYSRRAPATGASPETGRVGSEGRLAVIAALAPGLTSSSIAAGRGRSATPNSAISGILTALRAEW